MPEPSFLNPTKIIETLNMEEGMKVAEFGSGTGLFTLASAQKVGRDGKVYAIDVQKETLEALRARARMDGVFNIETVWADLEKMGSTKIPESSIDITLIPNVLFQSQKKEDIIAEARRVTRTGGAIAIIDWIPKKAIFGKAMGWTVSKDEMRRIAEGAGLSSAGDLQTGSEYHYGLLFRK